jgi:hypothetical protein
MEFVPDIREGHTLFEVLAQEAILKLWHFNSQDMSSMLWAYANEGSSNSQLFEVVGDSNVCA